MEDPADPYPWLVLSILKPFSFEVAIGAVIMLVLLGLSALISGAEVAYFSLGPGDKEELNHSKSRVTLIVLELLDRPKRLLATILIGNNFINVAIVVLSTYLMESLFDFEGNAVAAFWVQVFAVTLLILIIGEIIPKVYANKYSLKLAMMMAYPMLFMGRLFSPVSGLLVAGTNWFKKSGGATGQNISVDELSHALELTADQDASDEEHKILQGIVKFGNTDVKQIMTPRVDVVSFDITTSYTDMRQGILDSGFSRIPVFKESFDSIAGILYIKDLLPHLNAASDFDWASLIRPPFFVPENKKIDDLLKEFQEKKMHLAVVVDEYGGSSGIVTLEDILEEIVGEISDEFDDESVTYSKLDDSNFVFEGKTPLNDMYRILDIEGDPFENRKGDSDTLAGFVLEQTGKIPKKNERINFDQYMFTIEAADKRKIKRIKVTIQEHQEGDNESN